jgi:hypothetical protein
MRIERGTRQRLSRDLLKEIAGEQEAGRNLLVLFQFIWFQNLYSYFSYYKYKSRSPLKIGIKFYFQGKPFRESQI